MTTLEPASPETPSPEPATPHPVVPPPGQPGPVTGAPGAVAASGPAAPAASDTPPPTWTYLPPKPRRPWQYVLMGAAIPTALIVVVAVVLPLVFGQLGGMGMGGQAEYQVAKVDFSQPVTLTGTIEPTQRLDLRFATEGDVTSVAVRVGDAVNPGTVLATVDDTELRGAVSDASAEADAAWKDYQAARKAGSSSATALRSAHAAKAEALRQARVALEKAQLVSTIDGVVAAVNVHVGDRAGAPAASATNPGASASADIVVISRTYQVAAQVGSAERARVTKGAPATVRSPSLSAPVPGTVTSVGVIAEAATGERSGAATFPVVVGLTKTPGDVFAGAAATVEVDAGGHTTVLAIPASALLGRTGDHATVLRKVDGQPQPTEVTLGAASGDLVAVVAGLNEGDTVVLLGMPGAPGGPAEPKR